MYKQTSISIWCYLTLIPAYLIYEIKNAPLVNVKERGKDNMLESKFWKTIFPW